MLPHSGYVIAATTPRDQSAGAGGDWMLFDCGPIAGGLHGDGTPSVGHGHADLLQLLLFQNGKPVLIDSGMPRYAGSRQWVDHFRDAAAHNTISLSGASACQHAGRLAWKQVDFRHEIQHALHNGVCLARGRVSLRSGDLIERTVIHLPGLATWVVDWLRVTTKRIATWNWHQPVDCESAITMWDQSGAVKLAPTKLRPEDPAGWIAPGYGQLVPGKRLSFSREVARKVLVATCIAPVPLDARLKYGEQTLVCQSAWNSISATEPKHVSFHRLTAELFVPATAPAPVLNTTMAEAPAPTT